MTYQRKNVILLQRKIFSFLWIGGLFVAQAGIAGGRKPIDMFNPTASMGETNGFGVPYQNAAGTYLGNTGAGCQPNLGNEVAPQTVGRYFKGLTFLKTMPALPANGSRVAPAKQVELLALYNTLLEMEAAEMDMLGALGQNHINLKRALDKLAYQVGRQRIQPPVDPIITMFGVKGVNTAASTGVTSVDARKVMLQLVVTTNKDLYNTDKSELKKYQDIFSEIITADVAPAGVDIEKVKLQFLRIQRALGKDPVLMQYPDAYVIPENASSTTVNNEQKIQVIVNRWISGQANLIKFVSSTSLLSDRQTLVAAKLLPELSPVLRNQMELAIAQIDAMQLRILNEEIKKLDFEQHFAAFKKALLLKAQNPRAVQSKVMDVTWLTEKLETYDALMEKVKGRVEVGGFDVDLMQGLKIVLKASQEYRDKIEQYKELFSTAANAPVKRVNLQLQTELERIYNSLSQTINTANILKDTRLLTYEATLKQGLTNPENMPDKLNIIQVRNLLKVLQKAIGVVHYQRLKAYEKKIDVMLPEIVNLNETVLGQQLAPKSEDFEDEVNNAKGVLGRANSELEKLKSKFAADSKQVKAAEEKVKAAEEKLRTEEDKVKKRAAQAKANAVDKQKYAAMEKAKGVIAKKMAELAGVKDQLDQLAQAIINGAFANPAAFGGVNVSEDQAMDLMRKVDDGLVRLGYEEIIGLNDTIQKEAKNAQTRLTTAVGKVKEGEKLSPKTALADMRWIKLSLIYGIAEQDQNARKEVISRINSTLLNQLMNDDYRDLSSKFDEKMQNKAFALKTLGELEDLVEVQDAQGPGRAKARELIDRIVGYLETKK